MANLQRIRRRIRSVSTTRQITKAMQLVAASQMRRAQTAVDQNRAYTDGTAAVLARVQAQTNTAASPLYATRPAQHQLMVVIAADRGLAGVFSAAITNLLDRHLQTPDSAQPVICVGRRAAHHVAGFTSGKLFAVYPMDKSDPLTELSRPLAKQIISQFVSQQIDLVQLIYTRFDSTLRQEAITEQLLPVPTVAQSLPESISEPGIAALLDLATRQWIESRLLAAILNSRASEQSARMVAMLNATNNAADLIDDLTGAYHEARQAGITQEIAELAGGMEAVNA